MNLIWQTPSVIAQTECIARSLQHWTGRDLWPIGAPACHAVASERRRDSDPARSRSSFNSQPSTLNPLSPSELSDKIFHAPFVLVSHGTEPDPILNYGNQAALALWEMSWDKLTRTPSRLTAEAPNREERARLLAAVTADGFIDDYSGIRISKTGRRFRISQATVWNLLDERQNYCGQAAMFSRWEFLSAPSGAKTL